MDHSEMPVGPAVLDPPAQRIARVVAAVALVALGVYVLQDFLRALLWAVIFGIATWPLYKRFRSSAPGRLAEETAPLVLTLAIGLVFVVPLIFAAEQIGHEAKGVVAWLSAAQRDGMPVPDWVVGLPGIGGTAAEWWRANLSDPAAATELFGKVNHSVLREYTRELGLRLAAWGRRPSASCC